MNKDHNIFFGIDFALIYWSPNMVKVLPNTNLIKKKYEPDYHR
jgi:hypothetical protein